MNHAVITLDLDAGVIRLSMGSLTAGEPVRTNGRAHALGTLVLLALDHGARTIEVIH